MQVNYGRINKKINSTYQPSLAEGAPLGNVVHVALKEGCSVEVPIFEIAGDISQLVNMNYVCVPEWGKYYYINDMVVTHHNLFEWHCTLDRMATYKSDILGTTAYVEYANIGTDSIFFNSDLPDRRISTTNEVLQSVGVGSNKIYTPPQADQYILATAGDDPSVQVGFLNYYNIQSGNIARLARRMYDTSFSSQFKDFFNSPYEGIVSCHYIPWQVSGNNRVITVADVSITDSDGINITGIGVNSSSTLSHNITVPIDFINEDWRDFSPYSKAELYLPYYGTVDLDIDTLYGQSSINVYTTLDPISGVISYICSSGNWFATFSTTVKVDVGLGQSSGNSMQGIGEVGAGAIGAGVGVATLATGGTAGAVIAGVAGVAGGIGAIADGVANMFKTSTSGRGGVSGSIALSRFMNANADLFLKPRVTIFHHNLQTYPYDSSYVTTCGLPVMNSHALSNFSGYVKCANASVNTTAHDEDKAIINSYLNTGFYIE